MHTVLVVFGTRPEGIKLAPVIRALRARKGVRVVVANAGQHAEMLDQHLEPFGIQTDHRLDLLRPGQPLDRLTARALVEIASVVRGESPELIVVQGDTTTVLASALAAFYARVPVAHVEAGLRTGMLDHPFPEEMNRRVAGALATLHFAPTERARENLLREGVDPDAIEVTGNTVIDAVCWMDQHAHTPEEIRPLVEDPRRRILVTAHRRESWGAPMDEIGAAISELAASRPDVLVVFPIHPNPVVRKSIVQPTRGLDNVVLMEPLPYPAFVRLMSSAFLLLTDSGGVQEEAAALHKPVLVMREVTERSEGVDTGTSLLVGRRAGDIVAAVRTLLSKPEEYALRAAAPNPYGDGRAGERIAARIVRFLDSAPASLATEQRS